MKKLQYSLMAILLVLFTFQNANLFAQPMNGDYTVGLNFFREVTRMDIEFRMYITTALVEEYTAESIRKAEMGEVSNEEMEIEIKEVEQYYFVPFLNGREYSGLLYYELSDIDREKYNVNYRGVYATIGAAAADLNTRGVSGPVRLLLVDESYNSESFPITFNLIAGASETNTITLLPNTGVTATITANITQPMFDLNGCKYFIFDGRQNGIGSTNSFSLTNNSSGGSAGVIRFINGASYNIVRYMNLNGVSSTNTTRLIEFSTSTSNPDGNSNNLITRCNMNSTRYGIYFNGTAGSYNTGNVISYNVMYNTTFSNFFFSSNSSSTTIEHNLIYHTAPQSPGTNNSAMQVNAGNYGTNYVRFNKIYDLQTTTVQMRGIYLIGSGAESVWNIENNFISLTVDNASKTTMDAISVGGANAYTTNIFYNTVRIGGTNATGGTAGTVVSSCVYKNTTNTSAIFNMKNNIFYNSRTGGTSGVVHAGVNINNTSGTLDIDYNDYFSSGVNVRYAGVDYTDLAVYKAAVIPNDQNTIFKEVFFESNTDLHLMGSSNGDVDLRGVPLAWITIDIDGELRSTTYPYMGADEATIPIPVELLSFSANVIGNNVTLNWLTATESNNSGFEIQRRIAANNSYLINDMNWENIAFVKGAGTSTEVKNYSFSESVPSIGIYQYRLKQIDYNGTYSFSNIVDVNILMPNEFVLYQNYPNPFNPVTKIKFSVPDEETLYSVALRVYDVLGNEVSTLINRNLQAGIYEFQWDASGVSTGIYYCQLIAGDYVAVRKMILLK